MMGFRRSAVRSGKRIAEYCHEYGDKARVDAGPPRKTIIMDADVVAVGGTIYVKRGAPMPSGLPQWPSSFTDALGTPILGKGQEIHYLDRTAPLVWYVYSLDESGRWQPVEVHDTREPAEKAALLLARKD